MDAVLKTNIVSGPFIYIVYGLAIAAFLYVLLRRPTRRWVITASIAFVGGVVIAIIALVIISVTFVFEVVPTFVMCLWSCAVFGAVAVAIANFWNSRLRRKILAAVSMVFIILAGVVGVNADFGLNSTVAQFFFISTQKKVDLPVAQPSETPFIKPTLKAGGALWANWTAPSDLDLHRSSAGEVSIPNSNSGFVARPASVYLPAAALAKSPPPLPLVIFFMGQPGNPDPTFQWTALDPMMARNGGLAPIVLVVDQIGNPGVDPLCLDTAKYGAVETYIMQDVVPWARSNLFVLQDPAHWVVGGYSNGGECAAYLGAKHPETFGNVLDISGEEYAGATNSSGVLSTVFKGDRAAYDAVKPVNIMAAHGPYTDSFGIYTAGSRDASYAAQAQRVNAAAQAAGWKSQYVELPGVGHLADALNAGLAEGYKLLYPRLGLSDPAATTAP